MNKEKGVLFGIDDSDFAQQALLGTGGLLKNSKNLKITVFHGFTEPDFSSFTESSGQDLDMIEKYRERWTLKGQKVLKQAKESLTESGFDPDKTSTIFDKKCSDPAEAMLKMAAHEGIETLAVARWGKTTVSRKVIGSVTYRLSQLANDQALWIIDPRIWALDPIVRTGKEPG